MPFDPLVDITWDEVHWASDPSWTAPSDGGAVSSWRDGSGNSRNATQATGGNQPLYRASVAALNNKPAVEFDGTDDYLANGTSYTRAQPFTIVAVVNGWSTGAGAPNLVGFTGLSGRMGRGYPTANQVSIYAGGADYVGGPIGDTGSHFYTCYYNGASSAIGQDGTVTALGSSPGTTGITTGVALGAYDNNAAGNPAAAKLAFVGVYNGDFTANANYAAFKSWVTSTYGIVTQVDWLNPASDVTVNSWTTDTGGTTNLYQAIDEDTASDTDYIQSPAGAFTASYYETGLQSQAGDAGLSAGHVASYRYRADLVGGSDLTVSLRQGSSTEIAAWTHNNISSSFATVDQTLTGAQADNITYPTDLRLRFEPNADGPATPALVPSSTGSVSNLTGQASTALTVTSGMAAAIQVGHYMIAWVGVDNSGASGARPGLTVTDSRSNSWTVTTGALIDPGAASAGAACYIAYARITTAYQTSDTITFNWTVGGTSTAGKSISVAAFSGIASTSPVAVAEVAASGTSTAFTISITPTAADQLVVVAGAIEGPSGDAWTNDADTTNGSWSALTEVSTGNTGATDITLQGAYKVVTASGAQTWNSTITSRDWCANAIVFAPQAAARVQVSWAGLTIPYAAAPATNRWTPRFIYRPAVRQTATW